MSPRCQSALASTPLAFLSPAWSSQTTDSTPPSTRSFRRMKKSFQLLRPFRFASSTASTWRWPSQWMPMATSTAGERITPCLRTFSSQALRNQVRIRFPPVPIGESRQRPTASIWAAVSRSMRPLAFTTACQYYVKAICCAGESKASVASLVDDLERARRWRTFTSLARSCGITPTNRAAALSPAPWPH